MKTEQCYANYKKCWWGKGRELLDGNDGWMLRWGLLLGHGRNGPTKRRGEECGFWFSLKIFIFFYFQNVKCICSCCALPLYSLVRIFDMIPGPHPSFSIAIRSLKLYSLSLPLYLSSFYTLCSGEFNSKLQFYSSLSYFLINFLS